MAVSMWQLAFVLFPAIAVLHLHVSPFTKVEESFNIQAIHDVLEYGVPMSEAARKFTYLFDHMTFPGAVPRTFIGSLVISGLAKPQIWLEGLTGKASQSHVRAVLGGSNAIALAMFGRQVERAFGPITAAWYVVLQASQFHLWYYASRTLPNMFSFFLSTIALAFLLPNPTSSLGPVKRTKLGLYLMTVATVIFRAELAILLAAHCVWLFIKTQTFAARIVLIRRAFIPSIVPGALIALLLTISIDTYFWQSPTYLWPELSAFLSNIFPSDDGLGASAWGTQPFYWYFVVALPRLLMNQILMVYFFVAFPQTLLNARVFDSLIPSYAYVLVYSILPHKETRFMFPIVPSLTLVAAMTCTRLTINMHKNFITKLIFYATIISTLTTAFISHAVLLPLSAQNYPGGHALRELQEYYHNNYQTIIPLHNDDPSHPQIHVHLTNLALQSGITRFLEQPEPINDTEHTLSSTNSIKGSSSTEAPQLDPIILPGDGVRPDLTIYPKQPSSTPKAYPNTNRAFPNPTWIYDKSPSTTKNPAFWSRFDFVIVEPSMATRLPGLWRPISKIKSLTSPRVLRPSQRALKYRYTPHATTPSELRTYWTSFTTLEHLTFINDELFPGRYREGDGTTTLLWSIYPEVVAVPLIRAHDLLHDLLRVDWGVTRGCWIEIPLVTRLEVLRNCESGGRGCDSPRRMKPDSNPKDSIPVQNNDEEDDQPILIDASTNQNQQPLLDTWDALGPLVINKDGTVSRLDNWGDMNEQERKKTVEYLRKRNLLRMEASG